jgi:diguanylate cyclase (GGDEF)-like protein
VGKTGEFSIRSASLSSVVWYFAVLAGWTLIGAGIVEVVAAPVHSWGAPLAMTAVLLVVLELLPLVQGRGHDPQGVVMSTAFVLAMLFLWGPWPAIIMLAVASSAADLRVRKVWWKVLFNPAQYALSVGSAFAVMLAFGKHPSLAHPVETFHPADLAWMAGAWTVYFVVNLALVAGVLSWQSSLVDELLSDFPHYTAMTFAVLALSPLVVVVAQTTWLLLPLLLIPLLLLYYTAQMSLMREHEAAHDALTGLPNRTSLRFSIDQALARHRRDGHPFGLLLIDMDDFKRINDTLGHHVGDDLLTHFAERLRSAVRPDDQVARLGGDEFAVIVQDADEPDVRSVAQRIRAAVLDPIQLHGLALDVEMSIGIAICPNHGRDGDTLLRCADVAMYTAKEAHVGIECYAPERDRNSADRLGLLGDLRRAIDEHELELYYQPKVAPSDSSLLGVEALVRWPHPLRGLVPPDEFIPLAERSGIMPLLTERVVTLALEQLVAWRDMGMHVPIAVNISPTDLADDRLTRLVREGLRRHQLAPGLLHLEITERVVAEDGEETYAVLRDLRDMGVTISLDDFGTGYSSLLRLQSLPVDEIKIDRAFVSCLSDGEEAVGIVRAVIELAHALGLPAIAEGVETEAEWRLLNALGCDGAQGWYVARPMPRAQATEWARSHGAAVRPVRRQSLAARGGRHASAPAAVPAR